MPKPRNVRTINPGPQPTSSLDDVQAQIEEEARLRYGAVPLTGQNTKGAKPLITASKTQRGTMPELPIKFKEGPSQIDDLAERFNDWQGIDVAPSDEWFVGAHKKGYVGIGYNKKLGGDRSVRTGKKK